MSHKQLRTKAIVMRKKGMSFSQIKEVIHVSKSTLSVWLEAYPLSPLRLRELRDHNSKRIESYRATMKVKRDSRIALQGMRAAKDIRKFSDRELYVAGFFLFWGEGTKSRRSEISLANTDPAMIIFFIKWLKLIGAKPEKIKLMLHLYEDMDEQMELKFWSKKLGYPLSAFYKPYIKKSRITAIIYRNGFGHGTCSVRYADQQLNDYVLSGLQQIKHLYEKE